MKKKGFILIVILIVIVIISLIVIKVGKKNTVILNPTPDNKEGLFGIVYYNPVEGKGCTEEEYINDLENYKRINIVETPTNQKEGCMKWYVYKQTLTTYTMILDHNTTSNVAYNSNGSNPKCKEACTKLKEDTQNWKVSARMITADEIARITGYKNFRGASSTWDRWFYLDDHRQMQTAKSQNASKYSWLFDYTNNCTNHGCNVADTDSSNLGYWTSTPVTGYSPYLWFVSCGGLLNNNGAYASYGIRPVITIP